MLKDKNNIINEVTSEDFIQPDKISIQMGDSERRIVDSKNIIEKVHPHGKGLVDGNNFNIGKHLQFSQKKRRQPPKVNHNDNVCGSLLLSLFGVCIPFHYFIAPLIYAAQAAAKHGKYC